MRDVVEYNAWHLHTDVLSYQLLLDWAGCKPAAAAAVAGTFLQRHVWCNRAVCKQLSWPLIDKDDARDCLQSLPASLLQAFDANQLSYDIMFSYCETQLQLGLSTALDCPFARAALYHRASELATKVSASSW